MSIRLETLLNASCATSQSETEPYRRLGFLLTHDINHSMQRNNTLYRRGFRRGGDSFPNFSICVVLVRPVVLRGAAVPEREPPAIHVHNNWKENRITWTRSQHLKKNRHVRDVCKKRSTRKTRLDPAWVEVPYFPWYKTPPKIRRTRILKVNILEKRLFPRIRRNQKSVKNRG